MGGRPRLENLNSTDDFVGKNEMFALMYLIRIHQFSIQNRDFRISGI